jgi:glycosyltransferase involved in cell wall biosynthesis
MLAIVIPYFKHTFFEATLESLANQTDKRFKVYIGDDASPENPKKVLDKYKEKLDFVYHRFESNLGGTSLTQQWERCIALSGSEEWIMILGDDDMLGENVVEEFYENLLEIEGESVNVIRFATQIINDKGNTTSNVFNHPKIEKATDFLHRKFTGFTRSSLSEYVFKKQEITKIKLHSFPLGWHSDEMAILRLSNFKNVYSINMSSVFVRESFLSISSNKTNLLEKNQATLLFCSELIANYSNYFTLIQKLKLLSFIERNYLKNKKTELFFKLQYWYFTKTTIYNFFKFQRRLFFLSRVKKNENLLFRNQINKFKKKIKLFLENDFFYLFYQFTMFFNSNIKKQNRNIKNIPIIVISFNQLFFLKKLVSYLKDHDYTNIVIIDNNSDYKPLLEYFSEIENSVSLFRLKENFGHRVFWLKKEIYNKYRRGYFVVTDADIVPILECPNDFLEHFKKILDSNYFVKKVGFTLDIETIPTANPQRQIVIDWEKQFWKKEDDNGNFVSEIDTTFALYRPENYLTKYTNFFKAIRTKYPYTALHGGWYLDLNNLTEEQLYYFRKANYSNTWKIKDGVVVQNILYLNKRHL